MDNMGRAILFIIALVLSISVHEFGHAWAATKLGDGLPRQQGRLTLSPIAHTDPIGTLLFPLIGIMSGGFLFGWGRPVQTNPYNYSRRYSQATGSMLVAVAGPAMNLLLAILVSVLLIIGFKTQLLELHLAETIIRNLVALNISLMFFNLLPIPPLDGGAVLAWVLPRSLQHVVDFLQRFGFIILLGLMITGVLSYLMIPAYIVGDLWTSVLRRMALS
jgi:Zn-dependent protease